MIKIGIYGGSFNPFHKGHINSIESVREQIHLDKIYVVPAYRNPHRWPIDGPTPEQRLEIVKLACKNLPESICIEEYEMQKKGLSYTIDTLKELQRRHLDDELYLIVGLDQLEKFDCWQSYENILELSHLIITSRLGWDMPENKEAFPQRLRQFILSFDLNTIQLTTGKNIFFIQLQDVNVSASELRERLRMGKSVKEFLAKDVVKYINDNAIYYPIEDKLSDYRGFTESCAQILFDKKGIDVRAFDLTQLDKPGEFTLVCSGTSTTHTVALAESVIKNIKESFDIYPISVDGRTGNRWLVIDYGFLMVHVFYDFSRPEYNIEELWQEGEELNLVDKNINPASQT